MSNEAGYVKIKMRNTKNRQVNGIRYNGKDYIVKELADAAGVHCKTAEYRIDRGWPYEDVFNARTYEHHKSTGVPNIDKDALLNQARECQDSAVDYIVITAQVAGSKGRQTVIVHNDELYPMNHECKLRGLIRRTVQERINTGRMFDELFYKGRLPKRSDDGASQVVRLENTNVIEPSTISMMIHRMFPICNDLPLYMEGRA